MDNTNMELQNDLNDKLLDDEVKISEFQQRTDKEEITKSVMG